MQTMAQISFLLIAVLLWPATSVAAPDGKQLYEKHCDACHQSHGEGGIGLPLSPIKLANVSDDYLYKTIRLGRPGRIMPSYQGLSDAQVHALVAYLRSWSGNPGMEFSDERIVGDPVNGEKHYKKRCSKCHADDGSGEGKGTGVTKSRERRFMVMPAAINNRGYLESASDHLIRNIIIADREDSKMPSMRSKLSDQEINDVVAYVRAMQDTAAQPEAEEEAEDIQLSYVVESPNDFETTVNAVRQALTGSNFRIFADRYLEQGLIDEFSHNTRQLSLRFCNFNELYNMLNIEPRLGVVLPCRITVMERESGEVILVAPNMKEMANWFNNDELEALAKSMNDTIQAVLEEATF
jgi:cytochrome c oxidase cbb3-type subunit 3